jgi:sarcosine oxidase subunit delta
MLRIPCPYCGDRDHSEFSYGGPADVVYPDIASEDPEAWMRAVYHRDNPRGGQRELWHHVHGCRLWLVVWRDTLTHEIGRTETAHPALKPVMEQAG